MTISFDEAFGLFRKWKTESSCLDLILFADGLVFLASDWRITLLQKRKHALVLSDSIDTERHNLLVGLRAANTFHYGDWRDAPEPMRPYLSNKVFGLLLMGIGGSVLAVFETRPDKAER